MSVDRGRKLLRQLKYLVEEYFQEVEVFYTYDELVLKVKDGNSGGSFERNTEQ